MGVTVIPPSNPAGTSPGSGGVNLVDFITVADATARLALTIPTNLQVGDLVKQTDTGDFYTAGPLTDLTDEANWQLISVEAAVAANTLKVSADGSVATHSDVSAAQATAIGNLSGTNSGDEAAASQTVAGIAEVATVAEIDTGTDDTRMISPLGLAGSTVASNAAAGNTHAGIVTGNPHAVDLQDAHDQSNEIRGQVDLGSATFDSNFGTPFTFAGDKVVLPIFAEGAEQPIFAVASPGGTLAQFYESLVDRATFTVVSNTPDVVDLGTDLTAIDTGLGAQLGGVDQFPSLLVAWTDAGIKLSIALSVGGVGNVELTLLAPGAPFSVPLATDTWQAGTAGQVPMMLLKQIAVIEADGIVGMTGRSYRNRQVTVSTTARKDDYWIGVAGNSVQVTLPAGDQGDEFVIYNVSNFTGLTIKPDLGKSINGAATDAAVSLNGNFATARLKRAAAGNWVAEGLAGSVNIFQQVTTLKTSGTYLIDKNDENIIADTNLNPVTLNLPASPVEGQTHRILLLQGTGSVNALTIGRNGNLLDGAAADSTTLVVNGGDSVTLQYQDSGGVGWKVIAHVGDGVIPSVPAGTVAGGDLILFSDVDDSNKGKTATAAQVAALAPSAIFGADYTYSESLGLSTTTSAIFQVKLSLTTPALVAGNKYRISWSALMKQTDKVNEVRLYNSTDAIVVGSPADFRHKTDQNHGSQFYEITGLTGAKTFQLQWRDVAGANTQEIEDAHIEFWRVL